MFSIRTTASRSRSQNPSWVRRARAQRLRIEYLEERTLLAAPVAVADAFLLNEDSILSESVAGILANDTDDDGDVLTAVLVDDPSNGSLVLNTDGSFDYTPAANYFGTDTFTYQASDGVETSAVTTVTLTINAVNDAPTAGEDSFTVDEDDSLTVSGLGVLANDTDLEGDPLTVFLVDGPYNGTATLDINGELVYTPNPDFFGEDYISYVAYDGASVSDWTAVVITVNPSDDAPFADADYYWSPQNTPLTDNPSGLLANDWDPDGDAVTAVLVTGPDNGFVQLNADGSFEYTPLPGFVGTDSFTYSASDGTNDSAPATVTIDVFATVSEPPTGNADAYTVDEDGSLTVAASGVLTNDTDPQNDSLLAELLEGPANGTLEFNADGSFTYTPHANFTGWDFFIYQANDGDDLSEPTLVSIAVNAVNDLPSASDDSFSVAQNGTLTLAAPGVLANDSDLEGGGLTAQIVTGPSQGVLVFHADGSFTYTPVADFSGTDTFTYQANDGAGVSNVATVTIHVQPSPPAPSTPPNDNSTPPVDEQPSSDEAFIQDLYHDLLNRAADAAGLNAWVQFLQDGNTHDVVARVFWQSPEHRARQVDQWYVTFLHRGADEGGRTLWVNALLAGASETDVMLGFILSAEYQVNHGSDEAFIQGLYQDGLGRVADAVGLQGWLSALQAGVGRNAAAVGFLTSAEGYGHVVDLFYQDFLDRDAAAEEQAAWATLLQAGTFSVEDVAVLILSSPEYRNVS